MVAENVFSVSVSTASVSQARCQTSYDLTKINLLVLSQGHGVAGAKGRGRVDPGQFSSPSHVRIRDNFSHQSTYEAFVLDWITDKHNTERILLEPEPSCCELRVPFEDEISNHPSSKPDESS